MVATPHVLRPTTPTIAGYLRLGHAGHRKLADLHAAGRLPYWRVAFDAAHLAGQLELAKTLKANGCEIVLDPNFAEMATARRFGSSAIQKLAWANLDRPWEPSDFDRRRNHDAAKAIAEFAVKASVHAILASTHLVENVNNVWRTTDLRMCEAHFLLRHLDPAIRTARHAAKLKIVDDKVLVAVGQAKVRMVRLRDALEDVLYHLTFF